MCIPFPIRLETARAYLSARVEHCKATTRDFHPMPLTESKTTAQLKADTGCSCYMIKGGALVKATTRDLHPTSFIHHNMTARVTNGSNRKNKYSSPPCTSGGALIKATTRDLHPIPSVAWSKTVLGEHTQRWSTVKRQPGDRIPHPSGSMYIR